MNIRMSSYWKSVASVLTGTALAQLIPIVGALFIARLYAPNEFGIFSAWLGVVLLLGVIFTGRFETALAIEADGEPRRLSVSCVIATAGLAALIAFLLLGVALLLTPSQILRFPAFLVVGAIPSALAIAVAQTWQSWAAAEGAYSNLSLMRIVQAGAVTLGQAVVGLAYPSAEGLAAAHLLGVVLGLAYSAYLMPLGALPFGPSGFTAITLFWKRRRRFPMFSLPADSINTAAAQLPLLIVASRFGADTAGLLAMTMRVLGAPIGLLGKSVLDVFKRHAATSFRERGECRGEYIRTFKVLAVGSLAFCGVMFFASELLFAKVFGEEWRGAGAIAVWLLPMFALRFIASPLSYMVYIAGKQHVDLFWQVSLLGITIASLNASANYEYALQLYSVGYSVLYVIYLAMSYRFSQGVNA
jgi:O-antigen/teichoic acid export membrane protein